MEDQDICLWILPGIECSSEVKRYKMFNQCEQGVDIPICTNHLKALRELMILYQNGYDVEEILKQTSDWRKQEAENVCLAKNLKLEDVEI